MDAEHIERHLRNGVGSMSLLTFLSLSVYYSAQPINHVKWKCLLSKRRTKSEEKEKMFPQKSLLLFWGCTSVLMLSLGKLMKMCGIFISCESLTNRNLIAPFFVVLVVFFSSIRREKNHFIPSWLVRDCPCEVHHLWIFLPSPFIPATMTI